MPGLTKPDFEALSEFRYQLRRFLRHADESAKQEGLTPLQYLLLLHVHGYPKRSWASVGEIAERLQAAPHGVVALVTRSAAAGLVERRPGRRDGREVEVHLTEAGRRALRRVAERNRRELQSLSGVFRIGRLSTFNDAASKVFTIE